MSSGLPLLVIRPEPGNAATTMQARSLGLDARSMPLFTARPLAWLLPDPTGFDALLLTSAQAVRLAGPGLAALAALPVHAVGRATAAAAAAAGLTVATTGDTNGQELLDAMTSKERPSILWLCARDHAALAAHRGELLPLPCYAVTPTAPPHRWRAAISSPAVILVHSARAAAHIAELTVGRRSRLALVAISKAVAAAAGPGWAEVIVADRPDDAAMLAQAAALCHKERK